MTFASLPYRILHEFQIPVYDADPRADKDFYDRLEAAGFELDWGDDESGLFMKYLRRRLGLLHRRRRVRPGGRRRVKLAHGQVDHLTEDSVVLDGRHRIACRRGGLRDRLRLDERLGGRPHRPGGRGQGRQGVGLGWTPPRTLGRGLQGRHLWLEEVTGDDAPRLGPRAQRRRRRAGDGPVRADARRGARGARHRGPHPLRPRRGECLYNFWQDAENPRGLWRRTTLESYRKRDPDWEAVLDLDALAAAEDENWVWARRRPGSSPTYAAA